MGIRAHTHADSASTAPVKRSALGPPGRPRGDKQPAAGARSQPVVGNRPTTRTTLDDFTRRLDKARLHR